MKFSFELSNTYPHPLDEVWKALTDRTVLAAWLMETDFVPEKGRAFTMWCDDGTGGTDVYNCQLLELEPRKRIVWSWQLAGRGSEPPMRVEFRFEAVEGGTRLTLVQSGDSDKATVDRFKSGWPGKLEQLGTVLEGP